MVDTSPFDDVDGTDQKNQSHVQLEVLMQNARALCTEPMYCLLKVALLDFTVPYGGTADFAALTYQNVALVKTEPLHFSWVEVHFRHIGEVNSPPLDVGVAQIRFVR